MKKILLTLSFFSTFSLVGCLDGLFSSILYPYDAANKIPVPNDPPEGLEKIEIIHDKTSKTIGWMKRNSNPNANVLLYYHGNGSNIQSIWESGFFKTMADTNTHIMIFDYPKYGLSTGEINESTIMRSAKGVFQYASQQFPNSKFVFWGRSLGVAVATEMAYNYEPMLKGLVLTSGWDSAYKLIMARANFSESQAKSAAKGNEWLSEVYAQDIQTPTLILHGTADTVIPFDLGKNLFNSFPPESAAFIQVDGAGHNDLLTQQLVDLIKDFIRK